MVGSLRSRRQNQYLSIGELHKILLQGRYGIIAATTATPHDAQAPAGRRLKSDHSDLLTDPVDQARGIQQRCCLVQKLLHVECDFEALLVKPGPRASICCASNS